MRYEDFRNGPSPGAFVDAQQFTGNEGHVYFLIGQLQLDFLREEGCRPNSHVLEIGCGSLSAGHLLIRYLAPDHYVGVEPNLWLIREAVETLGIQAEIAAKQPWFLGRSDFDAQEVRPPGGFDYILSHSVLSHAAGWQLPQYLRAARKVIAPHGVLLASFILGPDTNALEWAYPDVTCFSQATVQHEAVLAGWSLEFCPEWRERMMAAWGTNYHTWLRATPI